ncbi:MAG: DinB family protein [Acidobacteriaceae bacterium]|nr:DinB family protein [Acidobacteriaceae bacterium]
MRKILSLIVLFVFSFAVSGRAQQEKPPKAAASPSKAVLGSWNDIGHKLITMAEDFPEDKYDYKATPAERTFAENLLHVAGVNYYFTNAVRGEKPPAGENPPRSQYKTKADVVTFVKKSFADGAAAIEARGDNGMSEVVVDPYSNDQTRISDYAYGFIEHSGEHYGQLVVYYRLNNIVPPESRPRK